MYKCSEKKGANQFPLSIRPIRAVAGQRSSSDLCYATTSVKIYDP